MTIFAWQLEAGDIYHGKEIESTGIFDARVIVIYTDGSRETLWLFEKCKDVQKAN